MNKIAAIALLAGFLLLQATPAICAREVKVINHTRWEICEFHLSRAGRSDWGKDLLGDRTIPKGGSVALDNIGEGSYDIRIVDDDGNECVIKDVSVGSRDSITIDPENLRGCPGAEEEETGTEDLD